MKDLECIEIKDLNKSHFLKHDHDPEGNPA